MSKHKIIFESHPLIQKWAKPQLFGTGQLYNNINARSKLLQKQYRPPLLCLNPQRSNHIRTKYEKFTKLDVSRSFLDMPDGGLVGVDRMTLPEGQSPAVNHSLPNILFFPGSTGNSFSGQVQTLSKSFLDNGYSKVFVSNYRGMCNTPLRTPKFSFPFGAFNDMPHIIEQLEQIYDEQWLLIGNCFGTVHLIDYMSTEHSKRKSILGAVGHGFPWNINKSLSEFAFLEYFNGTSIY